MSTAKRNSFVPTVPTIAETVPGFDAELWIAIYGVAGTPQPIIDKLVAATHKAMAAPEMKEKFATYNLELQEVLIGTPRSPQGANNQIENILVQLRDRQVAREQVETYARQEEAAVKERTLREAEAVAEQQRSLTQSRIAIEVAENKGLAEKILEREAKKQRKSPDQLRKELGTAAQIGIPAMLGGTPNAKALGAAVAKFVLKPGRLTVVASARDPGGLGAADIAMAQDDPTALLAQVNLQATAE